MTEDTSNIAPKKRGRPFEKGSVPNPNGRPQGSRNKATVALERLMEQGAQKVVETVMTAAEKGDISAARLILERVVPVRKGRPVNIALPPVETAADVVGAIGATVKAMADGDLTPDEAAIVTSVLEAKRKAIETVELEARLARLEQQAEIGK